jgi:diguanylate cyclase (GGDEF)-like protein
MHEQFPIESTESSPPWPEPTGKGYKEPGVFYYEGLEEARNELASTKAELQEVVEAAKIDTLTGLGSADAFHQEYEGHINRLRVDQAAVVVIDVANLKKTNDTFGHGVGNRVLALVGEQVKKSIRTTDKAWRVGGDEIVVVLDGSNYDLPAGESMTKELRTGMNRIRSNTNHRLTEAKKPQQGQKVVLPEGIQVGIGIGMAVKHDGDTPETLFNQADVAMEVDKRNFYLQSGVERRTTGPTAY